MPIMQPSESDHIGIRENMSRTTPNFGFFAVEGGFSMLAIEPAGFGADVAQVTFDRDDAEALHAWLGAQLWPAP